MSIQANVWVRLYENGQKVPGSDRIGHNVLTNAGRDWLARVAVWQSFGVFPSSGLDVAATGAKFRWIGVGAGYQPEMKFVSRMVDPLAISTGPNVYYKALSTSSWPTIHSVRFTTAFSGADFTSYGPSVDVSEAGILVDVYPNEVDLASTDNVPVAYKSFATLNKQLAQTLTITWEFRF